ncbi:hypothetical protein M8C21_025359, partial [Ambrosia artemisiifolia]
MNDVESNVTAVTVAELAGLNTLGSILVGFVTSNPENRLITKLLQKGDVLVFPKGLIHFQQNVGNGYALAIAALSSQNPGVITIANVVFGSNPAIAGDILAKAFQVDIKLAGLNTLGISMARIDFAPWGINPPHTHPRSTEILTVIEGRLHLMGNTTNDIGSNVTAVTVAELAGLNTLGISMARIDFAPWGINPPHTHPRATEILTVIEGSILVGFVTSNPENRLITKLLQKGDVFVFPKGLIHFQQNVGSGYALAIAALSSQNPGVITIANAVFGSNPDIAGDILAKAFQVDIKVVQ